MQKTVTFIGLEPSEAIKHYAFEKIDRLDKYLENPTKANIVFSVEKFRHSVEITLVADGHTINAHEETGDMHSAVDMALAKLENQLKKNKKRFKVRRSTAAKSKISRLDSESGVFTQETDDDAAPLVEKVKTIQYKPMDVEEAVLQMGLTADNFLVFTNSETQEVNVLYRLKGGNYGLVQPSE